LSFRPGEQGGADPAAAIVLRDDKIRDPRLRPGVVQPWNEQQIAEAQHPPVVFGDEAVASGRERNAT
jgi:hypothetical protein